MLKFDPLFCAQHKSVCIILRTRKHCAKIPITILQLINILKRDALMVMSKLLNNVHKLERRFGMKETENPDTEYILKLIKIDNEDKKDDTQRRMAWFALFGCVLYPLLVVLTDYLKLDKASDLIANMASVYFLSVSAIVMVFYGSNAYSKKKSNDSSSDT